ncbi:MAG TPA: LLM class flavin-dependent oxidoreductase [Chryseosolibacter sp.]|nr:LLM class flavin-dependent oxidoreductase [Chryseosolibacter sp.]
MELGVYTFAEVGTDPVTGSLLDPHKRLKNLIEEAEVADQAGLNVFAVGEHHRPDYAVSSPATVLAAAAVKTKNIRLSSAVTVLSSDDPVRVYQQFATVDLLSDGRAEIMAGRGSFIESFPLFGYDLNLYDELFAEKLSLLLKINEEEKIQWTGNHRPSIDKLGVYPRALQKKLPVWIAIGGTPASIVRAANLGLPLALAIIGGSPQQFQPHIKYYRDLWTEAGNDPVKLQVGINSHTFIGETSKHARDIFYPGYAQVMSRIGKERGWSPMTKEHYEQMCTKHGALLVGSPEEVTDKILYEHELFGHTRFLAQMTVGPIEHKHVLRSIELFGEKVAPAVRKAIGVKS